MFLALEEDVEELRITPEILALVAELDEFKGAWQAMTTLTPDRLEALRKVASIESVGSSTRIEGAKLSDREVDALLSRIEMHTFYSRDEEEVAGYAEVMDCIFLSYESIPLTESYIQQLHSMLLRYSSKDEHHRGQYKKLPNNVEAFDSIGGSLGVVFETVSPFETPLRMEDLVTWTRRSLTERRLHPLLVTALFVVVFLAIHPFQDGNGRLSRILTSLLLLQAGYAYVPFSSLESVNEQHKDSYYLALRRTQSTLVGEYIEAQPATTPNWEPWLLFFLRALKQQKQRLAEKLDQSRLMQGRLPPLAESILSLARAHGRVSVGEILRATGARRGTVKLRLTELVRNHVLARHGNGRSTWYALR